MENMKATERCTEKANDQIKKDKDTRRLRGKYQRRGSVGGKLSWTSKIGRVTHGPWFDSTPYCSACSYHYMLHRFCGCNGHSYELWQVSIVRLLLQAIARINIKVRLGAWSRDMAFGEEFRVGPWLVEPYTITWYAGEYFEVSGAIMRMLLQHLSPYLLTQPHASSLSLYPITHSTNFQPISTLPISVPTTQLIHFHYSHTHFSLYIITIPIPCLSSLAKTIWHTHKSSPPTALHTKQLQFHSSPKTLPLTILVFISYRSSCHLTRVCVIYARMAA